MFAPAIRIALALSAVAIAAMLLVPASGAQTTESDASTTVPSIELEGDISPATEGWIASALSDAAGEEAPLAIIRLDTPGGLDSSMREMVKDITGAPMPVVVYVFPNGARAGSAGVFVTQASDVAAMAPETNIGSASPITSTGDDIGGTLEEKITNDAAAYVRALATEHGRNPELAERMVREATNVSAREALDAGLIDLIASDQTDLLAQLDGFRVEGPKAATLDTAGYEVDERDMPLQYEVLALLVNPNIAFLLILIGLLGLALEAFAPGTLIPGAIGAVSLILGLVGAVQLPVAAIGVLLLLAGIGLIIAEAHLPTAGVLGVLGVGALIAGGLLVFDTGDEDFEINTWLVVGVAGVLGLGTVFAGAKAVQARHRPVASGPEHLIGEIARVRATLDPIGQVYVDGSLWKARVDPAFSPIETGYRVIVDEIDGLTLVVSPQQGDPDEPETGTADTATEGAG